MSSSGRILCNLEQLRDVNYSRREAVALTPRSALALNRSGVVFTDLMARSRLSFQEPGLSAPIVQMKFDTYNNMRNEFYEIASAERDKIIVEKESMGEEKALNHAERLLMLEVERSEMILTRQQKTMEQTLRQDITLLKKDESNYHKKVVSLKEKEAIERERLRKQKEESEREKQKLLRRDQEARRRAELRRQQQQKLFEQELRDKEKEAELERKKRLQEQLHHEQVEESLLHMKEEQQRILAMQEARIEKKRREKMAKEEKSQQHIQHMRKQKKHAMERKKEAMMTKRERAAMLARKLEEDQRQAVLEKIRKEEEALEEALRQKEDEQKRLLDQARMKDGYRDQVYQQAILIEETKKEEVQKKLKQDEEISEAVQQENEMKRELQLDAKKVIELKKLKNVERTERSKQFHAEELEQQFEEDQRRTEKANSERRQYIMDRSQSAVQMTLTSQRAKDALFELSRTGNWQKAPKTLNMIFSKTISNRSTRSRNSFLEVTDQLADVLTPKHGAKKNGKA